MAAKASDFSDASGNDSIASSSSFLNHEDLEENKGTQNFTEIVNIYTSDVKDPTKEFDDSSNNDVIEIKNQDIIEPNSIIETRQSLTTRRNNLAVRDYDRLAVRSTKNKKMKMLLKDPLQRDNVFLYKPFIPLPDLTKYLNQVIEVALFMRKYSSFFIIR